VDLRDRQGQPHPLIPDAGCRNTLYNAAAQSAADYVPKMLGLGVRHYRIELLRQPAGEVAELVSHYAAIVRGDAKPAAQRSLRVLHQLGVTRGTLERE
jgi:putative protease